MTFELIEANDSDEDLPSLHDLESNIDEELPEFIELESDIDEELPELIESENHTEDNDRILTYQYIENQSNINSQWIIDRESLTPTSRPTENYDFPFSPNYEIIEEKVTYVKTTLENFILESINEVPIQMYEDMCLNEMSIYGSYCKAIDDLGFELFQNRRYNHFINRLRMCANICQDNCCQHLLFTDIARFGFFDLVSFFVNHKYNLIEQQLSIILLHVMGVDDTFAPMMININIDKFKHCLNDAIEHNVELYKLLRDNGVCITNENVNSINISAQNDYIDVINYIVNEENNVDLISVETLNYIYSYEYRYGFLIHVLNKMKNKGISLRDMIKNRIDLTQSFIDFMNEQHDCINIELH
jgi:hypothetical protein